MQDVTKVPQIAAISDMKHRYRDVLQRLDAGPVVLTQRSQPVAVLVAPEQWNAQLDSYAELVEAFEALQKLLDIAEGETKVVDLE